VDQTDRLLQDAAITVRQRHQDCRANDRDATSTNPMAPVKSVKTTVMKAMATNAMDKWLRLHWF